MEFEAVAVARARAEAYRMVLRRLIDTAVDHPEGPIVLDRRAFDEALALLAEDERWRHPKREQELYAAVRQAAAAVREAENPKTWQTTATCAQTNPAPLWPCWNGGIGASS